MNKKNTTILIVDDAPEDVDILKELLSNYKLLVALNGEKTLQITQEVKPDLILLDIIMPGISGYEVCEKLKANDKTKDIPIIFITALDEVDEVVKGFQLGAVDYITKPFQPDEVLSRVKTHIELNTYKRQLENMNNDLQRLVEERTHELLIEKDKALESSRLKSHFLMLMSHELRTPMVSILGFSEFLMNECHDNDQKEMAKSVFTAANRLKSTINSVLSLSKLESSKIEPYYKPIDINQEIESLLYPHLISAHEKNIDLKFEPEDRFLCCNIDIDMFDIIINNIIGNAVKFTDKGYVKLKTFKKYDRVFISIIDTGIGIKQDKFETIFEEFRQAEEGVCRNFQGIGLGLSLVKKYSEILDGKIELQSEINQGTKFTISFPLLINQNQASNKLESAVDKDKKIKNNNNLPKLKYKILLVEDDHLNADILQKYLKEIANSDIAYTANEAITLAGKNAYDSIIMDINLGRDKTGIEATREIRKIKGYESKPIIAYTAFALDGDKEDFIEIGCSHYLPKPSSKKEIIKTVLDSLTRDKK